MAGMVVLYLRLTNLILPELEEPELAVLTEVLLQLLQGYMGVEVVELLQDHSITFLQLVETVSHLSSSNKMERDSKCQNHKQ
jgi:hypothetical protein